jgi:hypothetical protein
MKLPLKKLPNAIVYTVIAGIMILIGRLAALFGGVADFIQLHYLFNYGTEFLKRSLTGHIFYLLGLSASDIAIWINSWLVALIAIAMLYFFISRFKPSTDNQQNLYFLVYFAISPATISHIAYDLGRYDQLNLVLMLVSIVLVTKQHRLGASLIATVGVFVHEGFFFLSLPLLVAITIAESGRQGLLAGIKVAVLPSLAILLVLIFGNPETFTENDLRMIFLERFPNIDHSVLASAITVMFQDFDQVFLNTLHVYRHPGRWLYFIAGGAYFGAVCTLYWQFCRKVKQPELRLVLISPFASAVLFLVAIDYFRWIALICLNMFLAYSYSSHKMQRPNLTDCHPPMLLKFTALFVFLGPLGVIVAFPLINQLVHFLFGENIFKPLFGG